MIEIPKLCPSCGSTLERVTDQLFCRNKSCEAQSLKRLVHFAKTMKIKGLGEKTIEKLGFSDIQDIYNSEESFYIEVLGDKIGKKLFAEIEASKETDFTTYLAAFSIPLVGTTAATKLATRVSDISQISEEICKEVGIGAKATENIMNFIIEQYNFNYEYLPIKTITSNKPNVITNTEYVVCITGKLNDFSSRTKAKAELEALGIKVVDSVTKSTTHLICDEESTSSKTEKAVSLGIPISKYKDFIELIKE